MSINAQQIPKHISPLVSTKKLNKESEKTIREITGTLGLYIPRKNYTEIYKNLYDNIGLFLSKLPSTPAKKYVTEVLNRNLIYIGLTGTAKHEGLFAKFGVTQNKLSAIFLDAKELEIDVTTGNTRNIDSCVYATYFSFIRASVKLFGNKLRIDTTLNNLLIDYYQIIILQNISVRLQDELQRNIFKYIVHYLYYRQFFDENPNYIYKTIRDKFSKTEKESFDVFTSKYDILKISNTYSSIKDILKVMSDFKIFVGVDNLNQFLIDIVRKYKQYGLLCLIGTIDLFIASCITGKYPFEYFEKFPNNRKLQDDIENHIVNNYLKKVPFSSESLP